MAWFEDPISIFGLTDNVFTTLDILVVLVLTTLLALIVAKTYQLTHENVSYSKSFVQIMVVFGVVVSVIMLIIGSNIARAFTLVGALSIVRFRNAIKETRDVGFIFFMMAVGMAVGTRFYTLAVIMTVFISLLIIALQKMNFGSSMKNEEVLKVVIAANFSVEDKLSAIFSTYLLNHQFISTESTGKKDLNQVVFLVKLKDKKKRSEFIEKIRAITEQSVYLTETDYMVY
ncbi:MAG: DUF4956 domain-containing protein [Candidatus Diapherotrites archaeon]|nr:DUF4956 domain-containing protein [Candidatus Diapherotrites archaeon]